MVQCLRWCALLAALSLPVTAAAEEGAGAPAPRLSVGGFAGMNYLSDDIELGNSFAEDQVPGSGLMLGARIGVPLAALAPQTALAPRLWLEAEAKLTASFTGESVAAGREREFAPVLGWRAHALLALWSDLPAHPFVVAGGGGETLISGGPFVASPDTDAALYYGAGGRYELASGLALRADLRHLMTAGRTRATAHEVELQIGLEVRFGARPAPIPPPPPPEPPPPGPADRDADGIADPVDQCPDEPETINDIDDLDGCPERDRDGDGLLGSRDGCPEEPEDLDGFEDADGCPELDNDGDGIADLVDTCPEEPETINGFEDQDGCPDEVPEEVRQFTGVIPGITFESGSAEIRRSSYPTLDAAVAIFEKYPATRIRIAGHTDDVGSAEDNQSLSRARAQAVADYVIGEGIAAERVEVIGHGESQPVADNASRTGRAQNRRIELELIAGGADAP